MFQQIIPHAVERSEWSVTRVLDLIDLVVWRTVIVNGAGISCLTPITFVLCRGDIAVIFGQCNSGSES